MFKSLIVKESGFEIRQIVQRILDELKARCIKVYAVVDHQADMDALQIYSYPAFTIVFGNPAVGSTLLKRQPCIAIDIPLRIAVIQSETGQGSRIIYRDMEKLFEDYCDKVPELRDSGRDLNRFLHDLIEQSVSKRREEIPQ
ncbi:DUF302 domain-containing protein [Cohnella sp.]|uniref:DUF302 domain-containing protein n=1 Tax=Cohnella sp. TaxID=1883426 RepID=UPI00356752AA